MKAPRTLKIIAVLAASIAIVWLFLQGKNKAPMPTGTAETQTETKARGSTTDPTPDGTPLAEHGSISGSSRGGDFTLEAAVRAYVQNRDADPSYDWKQPINFYGKVVDESNQPVQGASVDFTWTDLSTNGTSSYQTVSDESGLFSMLDQHGKRLSVGVRKEGYYSASDARLASFEYANPAEGLFTPDPTHPVILHVRKKGTGAELVTSQSGVKKHLGVTLPLDGSPVKIALMERKVVAEDGQLILSQNKPAYKNWKQASEWSFRMEIPDGGFIEQTEEFPFEAPDKGYITTVEFILRAGQPGWTTDIQKDYYFRFGNPARYGRLHLETGIMMAGARLTYAVNPDGSRNLEPK